MTAESCQQVRLGSRRVRIKQSDLDAFLVRGSRTVTTKEPVSPAQLQDLADDVAAATVDGTAAVLEVVAEVQARDARAVLDLAIADFVVEITRAIADTSKPYGQTATSSCGVTTRCGLQNSP